MPARRGYTPLLAFKFETVPLPHLLPAFMPRGKPAGKALQAIGAPPQQPVQRQKAGNGFSVIPGDRSDQKN